MSRFKSIDRRHFLGLSIAGALVARSGVAAAKTAPGIKALKPGEFFWRPDVSPEGPVVVIVSLPEQLVHVYRNGIEIGVSTCSTGKRGHNTPTGVFTILQKHKDHYSSTYNNAPMPNMQRLTWRGIALHAGNLPGYPASHGCVRLPREFSKVLFEITHLGTPIIIANQKTATADVLHPGLLLPNTVEEQARAAVTRVGKKKAPKGWSADVRQNTASILVSGKDRKAYLMRDGVIDFEADISVDKPSVPLGTHVYSLIGPAANGRYLRWLAFGLGSYGTQGIPVTRRSDLTLRRIHLADRARAMAVASTLRPGTTMVITDFAATPETRTAPDFVVVTSARK